MLSSPLFFSFSYGCTQLVNYNNWQSVLSSTVIIYIKFIKNTKLAKTAKTTAKQKSFCNNNRSFIVPLYQTLLLQPIDTSISHSTSLFTVAYFSTATIFLFIVSNITVVIHCFNHLSFVVSFTDDNIPPPDSKQEGHGLPSYFPFSHTTFLYLVMPSHTRLEAARTWTTITNSMLLCCCIPPTPTIVFPLFLYHLLTPSHTSSHILTSSHTHSHTFTQLLIPTHICSYLITHYHTY